MITLSDSVNLIIPSDSILLLDLCIVENFVEHSKVVTKVDAKMGYRNWYFSLKMYTMHIVEIAVTS